MPTIKIVLKNASGALARGRMHTHVNLSPGQGTATCFSFVRNNNTVYSIMLMAVRNWQSNYLGVSENHRCQIPNARRFAARFGRGPSRKGKSRCGRRVNSVDKKKNQPISYAKNVWAAALPTLNAV